MHTIVNIQLKKNSMHMHMRVMVLFDPYTNGSCMGVVCIEQRERAREKKKKKRERRRRRRRRERREIILPGMSKFAFSILYYRIFVKAKQ